MPWAGGRTAAAAAVAGFVIVVAGVVFVGSDDPDPAADPTETPATASAGGVSASGAGGASGSTSDEAAAVVPHNDQVAIYDTFGVRESDRTLLADIKGQLESEGYTVTEYRDSTSGAGSQGSATLANFVSMADTASVIIINSHGFDLSQPEQNCLAGTKGLNHCQPTTLEQVAGAPATTTSTTQPGPIPFEEFPVGLQIEWYPTWEAEHAAYLAYLRAGYEASWLIDPTMYDQWIPAGTGTTWRPGGDYATRNSDGSPNQRGEGYRPWLGITAAGIEHFFADADIQLIDNLACHSISVADSFDADSYFGHASTGCALFEYFDDPLLFRRLTGTEGVPRRTTVEAFAAGGFRDAYFEIQEGSTPVVLSPAVEETTPAEGSRLASGETTEVTVDFDAEMVTESAEDVVTVEGCGAEVQNATWSSSDELSFDLVVPDEPSGSTATLTVHHDRARAEPGDAPNHQLDGDADPVDESGRAPNRDDYVWRLSCGDPGSVITIQYEGSFSSSYVSDGFTYDTEFSWDVIASVELVYSEGHFREARPQGAPTLEASGTTVSSGRTGGPDESCTYSPAPEPRFVDLHVAFGLEQPGPDGELRRLVDIQGQLPGVTDTDNPGNFQLNHSGACSAFYANRGVGPYLMFNPLGGELDPDGEYGAMAAPYLTVDVDALEAEPFVVELPVDYTQDDDTGGHEEIVGHATVTVSLG